MMTYSKCIKSDYSFSNKWKGFVWCCVWINIVYIYKRLRQYSQLRNVEEIKSLITIIQLIRDGHQKC